MQLRHTFLIIIALCLALPASAQDGDKGMSNSAYLDAFLADFEASSDKIMQLAGAFSEEQYAWRPAEGIRSVSEVFVHVTNANIGLASALGFNHEMDRPAGPEAEQAITSKADVIADLEMGQIHVRQAVKAVMEEDLSGEISAFGQTMTRLQVLMILGSHSHEHLGQAIAYARSIGVAPPWSGG